MLALPVGYMNKLCLPVHSVERVEALESPSLVWELNLGLLLPRLRNLGHITIWAPLPSCKTANTTYLTDEETENLQLTTKLRLMVKGRKLKWIDSKKGHVRYQKKIRRKTQQRGYGKWRVKTNASLAHLDSEQTLLESSFLVPVLLWGSGDVEWEGEDRSTPRSMCHDQDYTTQDT